MRRLLRRNQEPLSMTLFAWQAAQAAAAAAARRVVIAAAALFAAAGACAQSFPDRPIHLLVPYSSGSITDVVARMAAAAPSQALKPPVAGDSKTGTGGRIA